ncbi:hypothetical protein ACFQZE_06870 [Paenibacillus sp. GCM10027627]|uniref:hypothetical protein n=1 Tax=unclassified Paenibacillus TaxID=185978 RepID=UPI00362F5607
MNKVVVTRKQRNLLVNSTVTLDYPWFLQMLSEQKKIKTEDIPEEHKSDFRNVVPFIIKLSGDEWKYNEEHLRPYEDMGTDARNHKHCSLCNQRNRYIFYIKNRLNNKTLNVGSDCIKEFADFDNLGFGMTLSQLKTNASKVRRLSEANAHIDGIDKLIANWDFKLDSFSVLIPNYIRKPYLELGIAIKKEYENFLKCDSHSFEELIKMHDQYIDLEKSMVEYEIKYKSNPFVASNAIMGWLKGQQKHALIELMKETGLIDEKTVREIYERNFIRKIENMIRLQLESLELEVEKFDYEENEILITFNMYNGAVKIVCSFKKFMDNYGLLILGAKNAATLSLKNLLRISDVREKYTKEFIVTNIDDKFAYFNKLVRFVLPVDFQEEDEIDIINKITGKVFVYNLSKFLKETSRYILISDEDKISKDEKHFLNLKGKWYTQEELSDVRETASEMSSNRFYRSSEEDWKYKV